MCFFIFFSIKLLTRQAEQLRKEIHYDLKNLFPSLNGQKIKLIVTCNKSISGQREFKIRKKDFEPFTEHQKYVLRIYQRALYLGLKFNREMFDLYLYENFK